MNKRLTSPPCFDIIDLVKYHLTWFRLYKLIIFFWEVAFMARHKSLIPKDFDGNYTEDMLTDRQKQVLDFIRSYAQSKGYPPSVREICKAVGLSSTASVHNHLFLFRLSVMSLPVFLSLLSKILKRLTPSLWI